MNDPKRGRALLVLRALLMGLPCKIDDYTYVLSENDHVCIIAQKLTNDGPEEVYLKTDMSVTGLIKLTAGASEDDMAVIAAAVTLNLEKSA